jgi:tetratricopeptide (TPR) repeat protein
VPGYEVLGELGKGGMGVVYTARQAGLNRLVALKMIRDIRRAGPRARALFRTEAEAVARLQHPNIVQIFEVGEHDGLPFFSLEFCPSGSLDRKLAGNPLPPRAAAALVRTLAGAVHAAHQANLIHLDLKPANVLLAADDTPKITDFGLAQRLDQLDPANRGAIMGTPSYMAPEQANARTDQISPLTDVYALGAVLYELLTGRPPFKGATAQDTLEQIRTEEPVLLHLLQPSCPRDLETICLKCLRKDPARRYQSAAELAADLGRFLAGEPIRARPVGALERTAKWARRKPAQAALAVALVLAAVVAAAGGVFYGLYKDQEATVLAQREEAARQRAERRRRIDRLWLQGQKDEADGELALARGQQDEAFGRFRQAAEKWAGALAALGPEGEPADPDLRRQITLRRERIGRRLKEHAARQQLQTSVKRFFESCDEVRFHDLNLLRRDPSARLAQVRRSARSALAPWGITAERPAVEVARALDRYRRYFTSAQQRQQVAAGIYEVLLAWADAEAALPGPDAGRVAGARRALRLLEAAQALAGAHGLEAAQTFHVRRARYLTQAGDREAAAERARAARLSPRTPLDHFLAALEEYRQGRLERALRGCGEVLRLQTDHFGALYLQALCQVRARRWPEARAGLTACLGRRPDFLWARLLRGTVYAEVGEHRQAEDDFKRALRQTADPLERYVILTNRSAMWIRRERWAEARADLSEAIRLQPQMHQAYVNLAELHRRRQQWADAIAALSEALARRPGDADLYHTRARVHLERKDRAAARRDFEQAVRQPAPGKPGQLASDLVELGHLKHQAGQHAAALADFAAALKVRPGYAPAYRQQAETLLALDRYAEAGVALDLYLKAPRQPNLDADRAVYRARGLIHARRREQAAAVEAYTRALTLGSDADTLSFRGWAYLQLDAPRAALADFNAALVQQPGHADALCGRALARVRLGRVAEALRDADAAVRGPASERLLLGAACVYARAAARQAPGRADRYRYEERAVALVRAALRQVPRTRQAAFWREYVQGEPALAHLWRHRKMLQLARTLER